MTKSKHKLTRPRIKIETNGEILHKTKEGWKPEEFEPAHGTEVTNAYDRRKYVYHGGLRKYVPIKDFKQNPLEQS
jgi:hypothetical protein